MIIFTKNFFWAFPNKAYFIALLGRAIRYISKDFKKSLEDVASIPNAGCKSTKTLPHLYNGILSADKAQKNMKIGLIKEQKTPPDRRVVLTPQACKQLTINYPDLQFKVEPSPHRVFSDDEYRQQGIEISDDLSDCDVLLGVKEVPVSALIPNKKYFFFSHTIKKQDYNRDLLRAVLQKNIQLFDHETLVDERGIRLVAFGYYAGLVGTYNGLRTLGLKLDSFCLPKAEILHNADALKGELQKIKLPVTKILVTGKGRVGSGIKEILLAAGIEEVSANHF